MVVDLAFQRKIIARAQQARCGDEPTSAVLSLGEIETPDGNTAKLFLRHAADALLMDRRAHIVLITRRFNPGAGLLALPGGFIDLSKGQSGNMVVESAAKAALREAMEETKIDESVLSSASITALGHRSYDRPFDIRSAWVDIPETPIHKGDLFCVSTQGFLIQTTCDLAKLPLKAEDDAVAVHVLSVHDLRPEMFGIADHFSMIEAAAEANRTPRTSPHPLPTSSL